jgi:hypothetical protein
LGDLPLDGFDGVAEAVEFGRVGRVLQQRRNPFVRR